MTRGKGSACVFCGIVAGEASAFTVLEDADCLAFLDHRPLFPGHVLLLPRAHHETLAALPPELVAPLFANARRLARAVQEAFKADGSFVAINNVVSQSVPHLHVHVVPRRFKDGLFAGRMVWQRHSYGSDDERRAARDAILAALERTGH